MRGTQTKTWLFSYRWEGSKPIQISIGAYPQFHLLKTELREIEKAKAIDSQQHTIKSLYERVREVRIKKFCEAMEF